MTRRRPGTAAAQRAGEAKAIHAVPLQPPYPCLAAKTQLLIHKIFMGAEAFTGLAASLKGLSGFGSCGREERRLGR